MKEHKFKLILEQTRLFLEQPLLKKAPIHIKQESLQLTEILEPLKIDDKFTSVALLFPFYRENIISPTLLQEYDLYELNEPLSHLLNLEKFSLPDGFSDQQQLSSKTSASLKKMLLSITNDPKLILVKIAIHLHQLKNAKKQDKSTKERLAISAREIYSPLANRLGLWQLKWELEDLSFRFLNPEIYKDIAKLLNEKRLERELFISDVIREVSATLIDNSIRAKVTGRPKHIFSIWKKLQRKNVSIEKIFDVHAVRICVDEISVCYQSLGAIHNLWTCLPNTFNDYIANPKSNDYQSLHTSIIGPKGKIIEVQIRTHTMHHRAELGIAAHWRYKENLQKNVNDKYIEEIRNYLDDENIETDKSETALNSDERIFAVSPKGDVIEMTKNSTPLDFAYHIHTNVGHSCIGAKINGKITQLTQKINNGDVVDIITGSEPNPRRDWLNPQLGFIASPKTRSKINNWFRTKNKAIHLKEGKEICNDELRRSNISNISIEVICKKMNIADLNTLYIGLGSNDISPVAITNAIQSLQKIKNPIKLSKNPSKKQANFSLNQITVSGLKKLMNNLSQCCNPLPPEKIQGYITLQKGISIHRQDCRILLNMAKNTPERIIEVNWTSTTNINNYPINLDVIAYDRRDLLRDISNILSEEKISVSNINSSSDKNSMLIKIQLHIMVPNLPSLSRLMVRFEQLKNIASVTRQ